jgi:hypothetical protein
VGVLRDISLLEIFRKQVFLGVDVKIGHNPNNNFIRIKSPYVFIEVLLLCYNMKDVAWYS